MKFFRESRLKDEYQVISKEITKPNLSSSALQHLGHEILKDSSEEDWGAIADSAPAPMESSALVVHQPNRQ